MKWLTYDLETTFLQRGMKRKDTMIIEIALYGKTAPKGRSRLFYHSLVNPLMQYSNGEQIRNSLETYGQNVASTINFWIKLLIGKKLLNTSIKRKSLEEKTDVIADLLTKDMFKPIDIVLKEAVEFGKGYTWIAHNGTSFDSKILKGNFTNLNIDCSIDFADSLHFFRHHIKGQPSYSQPILYKSLFNDKYMAHHALEDAKALHKMLVHTVGDKDICEMFTACERKKKKKKLKSDLLEIKGIGQGSLKIFKEKHIHKQYDLYQYILSTEIEDFLKTFNKVYAYKKLAEKLYSGEIKLKDI